jgi:hypothetical protein
VLPHDAVRGDNGPKSSPSGRRDDYCATVAGKNVIAPAAIAV